jgi:hypothetical protein
MRALAMRSVIGPIVILLSVLALVVGSAALRVGAADHLDAPSLGSLSVGSLKGDRDINDVYVFAAPHNQTVLVMDTNPAVNIPSIDPFGTYGTNVQYRFNIDNTGDAVQDVSFVTTFSRANREGDQRYIVRRFNGSAAVNASGHGKIVAWGETGNSSSNSRFGDDVRSFAGERSDPFFFDLIAFRGQLGIDPASTQRFCSLGVDPDTNGTGTDFFAPLNTMAIVLRVPDTWLGTKIGVWADTRQKVGDSWKIVDQMGRPAINTVFNHGADKELFNVTPPSKQADPGMPFRKNVHDTVVALGGGTATADFLATGLIPDVITYNTTSVGTNILNGRALADDVIDVELGLVTGGGIPGDCVAAHTDYLSHFPYLGKPH